MPWDPALYEKFKQERYAPFEDLVALAEFRPGQTMVDLGCGTGELTARLAGLSSGSTVLGVDSSETMLARARPLERPGLRFELAAIETWSPAKPLDIVFSHAALQWVDDHGPLFARIAGFVARGGQLLVQMPSNHGHISHRLARELAATPRWAERLGGFVRQPSVLSIAFYAEHLHDLGLERPLVMERVYGHVLPDTHALLEWLRGTLLVPYLERLSPDLGEAFLRELGDLFQQEIPGKPYYFAFRRTLISARRSP